MNTKQLRQKILDLAIRGKLVPQDPNDEPASVLLERIKAEKDRLIAEGKIKRSKKSTAPSDKPHYADWDLPNGWVRCNLIDICTVFSTGPFGSMVHKSDYIECRGIPIVNPMNIIDGCIVKEKLAMVSQKKAHELTRYTLQKNDILIARRGDLSKCAIVNEQSSGWLCGTGSFFLHVPFVEPQYIMLFYLSEYVQTILKRECVGATMENLNQGVLGSIPLLLPPIKEQKRIIQKIKTLETIVFNIESGSQEIRRLTSQVKSKILEHAISGKLVPQDPADEPAADLLKRINPNAVVSADTSHYNGQNLPNGWIQCKFSDLFNVRSARRVHKADWRSEGIPFYRAREIGKLSDLGTVDNDLYIDNLLYSEFAKSGVPQSGDIMITAVGTLGKTYIVRKGDKFYYKDGSVLCIENRNGIDPRYIEMFISSSHFKEQYIWESQGTTVATLTMDRINSYSFVLPPLNEQKRIVSKVDELFAVIDQIKQSLE